MRTLLLALALVAPCVAQVKGPDAITVPVGRLATVPLTVDADEADYLILGADCDGLREYDPDPKKLKLRIIGYSPGVAWVVVNSAKGGKLCPPCVVRVTFEGKPTPPPEPPAPPIPPPGPPPDPPKPVPQSAAWVVLIADQDADTPGVAAVVASPKFRKALADWGLKFRLYDKGSPAVRDKGYLAHTLKSSRPCWFSTRTVGLSAWRGARTTTRRRSRRSERRWAGNDSHRFARADVRDGPTAVAGVATAAGIRAVAGGEPAAVGVAAG
jgi:hypothetical protein